jgi:hypothetical protein
MDTLIDNLHAKSSPIDLTNGRKLSRNPANNPQCRPRRNCGVHNIISAQLFTSKPPEIAPVYDTRKLNTKMLRKEGRAFVIARSYLLAMQHWPASHSPETDLRMDLKYSRLPYVSHIRIHLADFGHNVEGL